MFWEILLDALRNAVLITGLVVVMMMLIETMNIDSGGRLFARLKHSRFGQVIVSTLLGLIPGCMGGFASVSLYSHGIIGFGALVAMMIASSGDEAFVMLAMIPRDTLWICCILFVVAVAVGMLIELIYHPKPVQAACCEGLDIHDVDIAHKHDGKRHLSWKRLAMFAGVVLFVAALLAGLLEHEEHEGVEEAAEGFNLLSEEWMYWLFGAFSLIVLAVLIFGSDHFVDEHLWHHIVVRHLPSVFGWSFGILLLLGVMLQYMDVTSWISSNTALMIVLAALVGLIPESGPHMAFVTLYASGIVPLPVLLASCISQDGHASLPLLAESKRAFLFSKAINLLVAIVAGFVAMLFV